MLNLPVQKLPNLFPSSDPDSIEFSSCGRRGAHGVARVGTTSDYDTQNYFQISYCRRDIVVTILKLKCQKQKIHGEFGSTELLVRFLISPTSNLLNNYLFNLSVLRNVLNYLRKFHEPSACIHCFIIYCAVFQNRIIKYPSRNPETRLDLYTRKTVLVILFNFGSKLGHMDKLENI